MTIDGGMRTKLTAGSTLVARYKGVEYQSQVIGGPGLASDGKQQFRLADGREFKSPSAAGSAIMGGIACNGWRFWSLAGADTEPKAARTKSAAKAAPKARQIAKAARQATPTVRPVCDSYGKHFISAAALAHHEAHADRLCTAAA